MKTKRKIPGKKRKNLARKVPPFPVEFRINVARLHVEDGYPATLIAEQFGISEYSVYRWGRRYRRFGEQGLLNRPRGKTGSRTPAAVRQNIIDLKTENPARGAKRISDILKRFFMVGASPSTVQRTLKSKGLSKPAKTKRKKNPAKPRFFERATPNQMWQSDIMTFRPAGKNAYLIGYHDPGQDRAVLAIDPDTVFTARPVYKLRGCGQPDRFLDQILQLQAPTSGHRRTVSG